MVSEWPRSANSVSSVVASVCRYCLYVDLLMASGTAWSLIGTEDHAVPPSLQEQMSTHAGAHISFVKASHLSLITRPNAVVDIIDYAVHATS
jgi:hypothetical protein